MGPFKPQHTKINPTSSVVPSTMPSSDARSPPQSTMPSSDARSPPPPKMPSRDARSPPLSSPTTSPRPHDKHDENNTATTSYSINNTSSRDNNNANCVNIKIKSKGSAIRSLQAIIDTGNNLPHILLSMEAFTALKAAGIAKADLQETSIQATSADSNEIEVLGTIDGNFTLYIGRKNVG